MNFLLLPYFFGATIIMFKRFLSFIYYNFYPDTLKKENYMEWIM